MEQYTQDYLREFQGDLLDISQEQAARKASDAPAVPPPVHASGCQVDLRETPPDSGAETAAGAGAEPGTNSSSGASSNSSSNAGSPLPAAEQPMNYSKLGRLVSVLYTKLCRVFHPDRPTGNEVKFLRLQEDYEKHNVADIVHLGLTTSDAQVQLTELVQEDEITPLYQNIEEECRKLSNEIGELMTSLPWIWGNAAPQEKPITRLKVVRKLREHLH